jgi:hypothetical protein
MDQLLIVLQDVRDAERKKRERAINE